MQRLLWLPVVLVVVATAHYAYGAFHLYQWRRAVVAGDTGALARLVVEAPALVSARARLAPAAPVTTPSTPPQAPSQPTAPAMSASAAALSRASTLTAAHLSRLNGLAQPGAPVVPAAAPAAPAVAHLPQAPEDAAPARVRMLLTTGAALAQPHVLPCDGYPRPDGLTWARLSIACPLPGLDPELPPPRLVVGFDRAAGRWQVIALRVAPALWAALATAPDGAAPVWRAILQPLEH